MSFSRMLKGAISGLIATLPMSVAMLVMWFFLPWHEKYTLPPGKITNRVTEATGLKQHLDKQELAVLTIIFHFLYGAFIGGIYGLFAKKIPFPSVLKGIGYGLFVWLASYEGWLPAMDILPPAKDHPTGRNILMIIAHIIWGATAGFLFARLDQPGPEERFFPRREPKIIPLHAFSQEEPVQHNQIQILKW